MRDDTGFPNCCCRCLRPNPGGSWHLTKTARTHLFDNVYETRYAEARVPMCAGCRWDLRFRVVIAAFGALAVVAGVFGWWYLDTKGDRNYLLIGAVLSFFAGIPVFAVLAWLLDADAPWKIAVLSLDGSGIQFANPEYQRMYIGEAPAWRKEEAVAEKDPWR